MGSMTTDETQSYGVRVLTARIEKAYAKIYVVNLPIHSDVLTSEKILPHSLNGLAPHEPSD